MRRELSIILNKINKVLNKERGKSESEN